MVISVLVGTAVLTGCSEKQPANDTLPSSSAAETSESLPEIGPADFPVPDEARTKDAAGAEAFMRYYIDLLGRQQSVPSGEPLRDLAPDCQECLRIAQDMDEAAAAQRRFEGGKLTLAGEFGTALADDSANLSFLTRIEAGALVEPSGEPVPGTESPAVEQLPSAASLVWLPEARCWQLEALNFG
ncbi:hypothetical protein SAMN06272739_4232 [Blastococcus haudaquaticus]|uniref:Uncharacterized protein n=1 Tax=Blastococcus haudaquaticus TaxID=1938745 RepID=A0A286H8A6_9ACTN|nr:hypothetical protein SAMN06272739_4232 [Blastococcus haudaquaticus]